METKKCPRCQADIPKDTRPSLCDACFARIAYAIGAEADGQPQRDMVRAVRRHLESVA